MNTNPSHVSENNSSNPGSRKNAPTPDLGENVVTSNVRHAKKIYRKLLWLGIIILAIFAVLYAKTEVIQGGNEASRFAVIQAVGEQGVFYIERTVFRSVDMTIRDGHAYSDKPLLIPWTLGMIYRIPHKLFGLNFDSNYFLSVYFINLLFAGTVNILLFSWLFKLFCRNTRGNIYLKFLLAMGAPLGTWLLSYSVTLNNHTPTALCVLGLYAALDKFRRKPSWLAASLAGLAAGGIGGCDILAGLVFAFATVIGIFLISPPKLRYSRTAVCIATGVLVGVLLALLNFYAYKTVIPLYVAGKTATYAPSMNPNIIKYSINCLIGTRGLFSYQPFLLLAFPAIFKLWDRSPISDQIMFGAATLTTVFYLMTTSEYGGCSYGFRYLVSIIPILWYWSGRWIIASSSRLYLGLASILIAIGIITAVVGSYCPFCLSYEGPASRPTDCTQNLQSTFSCNLLSWSFENNPDSFLVKKLFDYYDPECCWVYLRGSAIYQQKKEFLQQVTERKQVWDTMNRGQTLP